MISTSSHICSLTSRVHCMIIQSMTYFWADICSPGRRCCSTITLSLWIRRYDVCNLVLPSTTLKMIRSSGYGRSSIAFHKSGLALINSQRLRWRLPKIIFFLNRYLICPLILCVTCIYMHKRLTSSNDRLYSICKYWLHCTSWYEDLTIVIADFIFPVSTSVSIPYTIGPPACSLILCMVSVVCLIPIRHGKAIRTDF